MLQCVYVTCSAALLAVAEGGGPETPQPEVLGPLLPCGVTCLVGVPQLFAVVAELRSATFAPTGDLWAAGTAKRNDGITGRGEINGCLKMVSSHLGKSVDVVDESNTRGQQG